MQSVAFVRVFSTASPRIDAIVGLELLAELVYVDGFNVAPDGILHLDAIA